MVRANGYKKISRLLKVLKGTVGSIIQKFKATGIVTTRHGRGRKKKLSGNKARFQKRPVDKNPRITAKYLKESMAEGGTCVSVDTVRHTLHA